MVHNEDAILETYTWHTQNYATIHSLYVPSPGGICEVTMSPIFRDKEMSHTTLKSDVVICYYCILY